MQKLLKKSISLTLVLAFIFSIAQFNTIKVFAKTNSDFTIDTNGVLTSYHGAGGAVVIPDGVTSIGGDAFGNCTSLISITIPNSVTSIGEKGFLSCTKLTNITIPNSVIFIGSYAFCDCSSLANVTIPSGVTSIGNGTFSGCASLTSINIPNSVGVIFEDAFHNCSSLTNITIPNSVEGIWNNEFDGCTSLTSINVDSGNKKYSSDNGVLFNKDKTSLIQYPIGNTNKSYTIPNSVTDIAQHAFINCANLTSINVDSGNKQYSSEDGVLFNKDKTCLIQYPIGSKNKSYTIPSSVTSIGIYAFAGCTSLTNITIPNSVTNISCSAFEDCTNLTSVAIPNSVTGFYGAFIDCTNLASIDIPNSVTNIDDSAFLKCYKLTIYGEPNSYAKIYANNNNIPFKYSDENPNRLYSNAYSAVAAALSVKSQKSINDARTAISSLKDTDAAWAIGEFSKQVDQVQHPILVKVVDAINKAQGSLNQSDINAAKASIDSGLPQQWKNSYSAAVDATQQKLIQNAIAAHNKAVKSKLQVDIDAENALIKDIETATDTSISEWIDKYVKGQDGII